jgi:release factor glutamine methyltransferase
MTPRDLAAKIAARLAEAGVDGGRSEAWLLLAAATGVDRAALVAGQRDTLTAAEETRRHALVRRRRAREPVAYLLGEKEFWSLRFAVAPAVLIPRPETETVVEAVLAHLPDHDRPLRLLDLGVGSGCLLLALLSEMPQATGLGVDDSAAALAIAQRNAERLGLTGRAEFRPGRWGERLAGQFDVIVSNPPYVAEGDWDRLQPEIRDFEPKAALAAGPDGLAAYRALAPDCARLLAPGALCALEIGLGQGEAVAQLLAAQGLIVVARACDLAGIERCVLARHPASDRREP